MINCFVRARDRGVSFFGLALARLELCVCPGFFSKAFKLHSFDDKWIEEMVS